ncbi:MAG: UDP-N-acetylmuramoyl-tripeptide--D-alanyl-D-alanine ligase [Planctomycetaceae bacterium]|nr:UDP-N-acetylmuramoyl-tripeptide--D-alanyl-D-alanine ligase [Planctomycetaceae bacterium]
MTPLDLKQLAQILKGSFQQMPSESALAVTGVSIDSRTIEKGQAFLTISGETFNGRDFAAAAARKGAACIITDASLDLPANVGTAVLIVEDTAAALARLAAWYRRTLKANVIAITGSVGKTTTRQILHHVLGNKFKTRQAQKSFNNHIGVPLTILSAQPGDQALILELGSNHPGEIAYLTSIAKPDAALITFVGPAHLEGFSSLENIIKEKASIAEGLAPGGILYANGDQPELIRHIKKCYRVRVVTFGTAAGCDIIGTDLTVSGQSGSLQISGQTIDVPLPGRANLLNTLAAWAVCRDCGVTLSDFADAMRSMKPVAMRLEIQNIGPLTVINDCYNANPASMANALGCLAALADKSNARSVFIAGSMGELGSQSAQLHHQLGQNAASQGVRLLLASGPFAREICAGAQQEKPAPNAQAFENTAQLCDNLHKWVLPDDIVLVKGSRSAGLEKAVLKLHELFEK